MTRYRSGIATLLAIQVRDTHKIEQKLGIVVGDDASERAVIEDMPFGPFRLHCALLLHKANMHMAAVRCANDSNNLHSLAVQMRPVFECAGQVVLVTHNLLIEPEHVGEVNEYVDRSYLGTMVRATKGQMNHEQLLAHISDIRKDFGEEPLSQKSRFRHEEKVAPLHGGKEWYDRLSTYFCHGEGDWWGYLWQGSTISTNTVQDEFVFAGFMDYLVEQAAVMNSYAALQIPSTKTLSERVNIILDQLNKVRDEAKTLRDSAVGAVEQMKDRN